MTPRRGGAVKKAIVEDNPGEQVSARILSAVLMNAKKFDKSGAEPGRNRSGVQGAHLNPVDLFLCTSTPCIWRILSACLPF